MGAADRPAVVVTDRLSESAGDGSGATAVGLANGQSTSGVVKPFFDAARAQAAVRELLLAVGEDPDRDGLRNTPGRVARASGRA